MATYTDGYGGDVTTAIDTYISENNGPTNYGTATSLFMLSNATQRRHALLRFDLSGLDAGVTITSATLYLYNSNTWASTRNYAVNAILSANANWAETEATWNRTHVVTLEDQRWAGDAGDVGGSDAGCSVSGTDYNATAMGTFQSSASSAGTEHAISLNTAQVAAWLGTTNPGIIIRCTDASVYANEAWASSDHATTGYRPKLVIVYEAAGEHPAAVANGTSSATVSLTAGTGATTHNPAGEAAGTSTASAALSVSRPLAAVANGTASASVTLTNSDALTYTDGYGGDVDTAQDTMFVNVAEGSRIANYGLHDAMRFTGAQYVSLLRFNLAAIPANSTCESAVLYLYKRDTDYNGAGTVNIHSVAAANAAWTEGAQNGTTAASGEPCWNALAADGSGGVTTAWAGSAGLGTEGTDYEAGTIGWFAPGSGDAAGTEYAIALNAERVQGWFGASNTNYGLRLEVASGQTAIRVASSEWPTTGQRPKLVVQYVEVTATEQHPAGQADGTSTASASLAATRHPAGAADGVATSTATLSASKHPQATADGTSTATAALTVAAGISGTANGTSAATVSLAATRHPAGIANGTSTSTAALTTEAMQNPAGLAAGTSTATASLQTGKRPVGLAASTSTVTVSMAATRLVRGAVAATSTATCTLTIGSALVAAAAGTSSITVSLYRAKGIAATVAAMSSASVSGLVAERHPVAAAGGASTARVYLEVGVTRVQLGSSMTPVGSMRESMQLMTAGAQMRQAREVKR